jgi:hypothetical protein
MPVTIRLPDTWSIEMVDHLLDFANQLNNAIIDQYGTALYERWNQQYDLDELAEADLPEENEVTAD